MLSEEEIEKAKECLKETIQNTYAEGKATKLNNALKYIKQLESDKQKIIEKLEEVKKIAEEEYEEILNSIDRKVSHTKDEHKIRATYAEFGLKKGRLEILEELLEGK